MSIIERFDLFSESLPRKCLYCKYGYPVVFGIDSFLDAFACGAHCVDGLKSKKLTLKLTDESQHRTSMLYCPMTDPWESCDSFQPIKFGDRKFKILDSFGYFDDMFEKPTCSECEDNDWEERRKKAVNDFWESEYE